MVVTFEKEYLRDLYETTSTELNLPYQKKKANPL